MKFSKIDVQKQVLFLILCLVGVTAQSATDRYIYLHEGLDIQSPSREIPYESVNGMAVIHEDIIVGVDPQYSSSGAYRIFKEKAPPQRPDSLGQVISIPSEELYGVWTWPDSKIPIVIPQNFPDSRRIELVRAVDTLNQALAANFVNLRYRIVYSLFAPYELAQGGNLVVTEAKKCASWVGRIGRWHNQELFLNDSCEFGSIMHELLHSAGLEHTHNRPDRDDFVEVFRNNIQADKLHNFDKLPKKFQMPTTYDFESLMHYGAYNFGILYEADSIQRILSGGAVAMTLQPQLGYSEMINVMGQRLAPSAGDIESLRLLYGSTQRPTVSRALPEGQYALNQDGIVLQKWNQFESCRVDKPYQVGYADKGRPDVQTLNRINFNVLLNAWKSKLDCY